MVESKAIRYDGESWRPVIITISQGANALPLSCTVLDWTYRCMVEDVNVPLVCG
jgi:hypothetical protein